MEKRFSVIISAYNIEKYIKRAIDSVLNQTFKNFELIVVNDCSTDETLKIIKGYNDERLIIINNEKKRGLGAVRNIGIEKARGEYIVHLDGDDTLYEETTLEKIHCLIGEENPDIVYLGFKDVPIY